MNTIDIAVSDGVKIPFTKKDLITTLDSILEKIGVSNVELSVSFVTEEEIHRMNKEYRNIDDSTDILSFASEDDDCFVTAGKRKKNIGDIVISVDVVKRNCVFFNVAEAEEIKRLLVHGVLHLNGEDHKTNDFSSEPMLIRQEEILKSIS